MHKKALIFWGGWEGHTPERSANVVKDILSDNDFDVRIEQGTSALADPAIDGLHLIGFELTTRHHSRAPPCFGARGSTFLGGWGGHGRRLYRHWPISGR